MDFLWSPWRYTYVSTVSDSSECPFCIDLSGKNDADRLILHRAEFNFVIMNMYPYTSGHLMIVPYAHIAKLGQTAPEQMNEMMALSIKAVDAVEEVYHPNGFNIGMNLGESAGAAVRHHLHLHIVPRWSGDANFMSTVGEARVLPESLENSYEKLRPLFNG